MTYNKSMKCMRETAALFAYVRSFKSSPSNSNAIRKTKSLGSLTGLTDLGFQITTVEPGHEYSEYHRHLYEEQCFYILSGHGEVIIDGKSYSISVVDILGFWPIPHKTDTVLLTCLFILIR